jgi:hypothetical protein
MVVYVDAVQPCHSGRRCGDGRAQAAMVAAGHLSHHINLPRGSRGGYPLFPTHPAAVRGPSRRRARPPREGDPILYGEYVEMSGSLWHKWVTQGVETPSCEQMAFAVVRGSSR